MYSMTLLNIWHLRRAKAEDAKTTWLLYLTTKRGLRMVTFLFNPGDIASVSAVLTFSSESRQHVLSTNRIVSMHFWKDIYGEFWVAH